ncbi:unnamed protein product, partial [Rotaria magnacalcarata]
MSSQGDNLNVLRLDDDDSDDDEDVHKELRVTDRKVFVPWANVISSIASHSMRFSTLKENIIEDQVSFLLVGNRKMLLHFNLNVGISLSITLKLDLLRRVQGLDLLAQDKIFTNSLNFVLTNNDPITEQILNRFCNSILPRIHDNVKCLVLETTIMDRILRAGIYSNLTQLKIFKFQTNIFSRFCTEELLFRHNFKKQIADLTLLGDYSGDAETNDQTTNVFIKLLDFFENLNSLSGIGSFVTADPVLSFTGSPGTSFVSSTPTKLCMSVDGFGDCLCLLDGRLNQLSTFIVIIIHVKDYSSMEFHSNNLPNLKCFSLTYEHLTDEYDNQVVPLLHRMCNLEDLTLYIQIKERNRLVDGIQLENNILLHLSKL